MASRKTIKEIILSELGAAVVSNGPVASGNVKLVESDSPEVLPAVRYQDFATPSSYNQRTGAPQTYTTNASNERDGAVWKRWTDLRFDVHVLAETESELEVVYEGIVDRFLPYVTHEDPSSLHADVDQLEIGETTPGDTDEARRDSLRLTVTFHRDVVVDSAPIRSVAVDSDGDGAAEHTTT